MPTLAVALIVKNEEKHLANCLDSVKGWVDEIIILDSGSTDRTEEIARQYTDNFYVNDEWPGFGPQRQIAQQYVTADYVLWLDADEQVTNELKEAILNTLAENKPNTVIAVNRLNVFLNQEIRHCGWYPEYVVRLHKNSETRYNSSLVHEKIISEDFNVLKLKEHLIHYPYNDISHYMKKSHQYAISWAEDRLNKGKKSSIPKAIIHSWFCFIKMYILKQGFLDGKSGLILCLLSAYSVLNKHLVLWEKSTSTGNKHHNN